MRVGVTMTTGEPRIEQFRDIERVTLDGLTGNLILLLPDGHLWFIPRDEHSTVVVMNDEYRKND